MSRRDASGSAIPGFVAPTKSISALAKRGGLVAVGVVPGLGVDDQPRPGDQVRGRAAVGDRDQRVALAPDRAASGRCSARYRRSAALTRWPPGSMIAREVCRNAARLSLWARVAMPRPISTTSRDARSPTRASAPDTPPTTSRTGLGAEQRQRQAGAGQRRGAQHEMDLAAQAAAAHEHHPVDLLGVLVGELHRDAAAERVPDDRRRVDPQRDQQVAHARGVRAQRVVAARLGRQAVAEQIGRDAR